MKKFIFLILISLFTELLFSEVIILKDESKIIGKIIKMDEDSYTVISHNGEFIIDKDDVLTIFQSEEDYKNYLNQFKSGDVVEFDDIIFYPDTDEIKSESYLILEKLVQLLNERKNLIVKIAGYTYLTDNQEKELLLLAKRVTKVSSFLIENGIESNRIKTSCNVELDKKGSYIDEKNIGVKIKIED